MAAKTEKPEAETKTTGGGFDLKGDKQPPINNALKGDKHFTAMRKIANILAKLPPDEALWVATFSYMKAKSRAKGAVPDGMLFDPLAPALDDE